MIGWKGLCQIGAGGVQSVAQRFLLADARQALAPGCREGALGCERFYMAPAGLIAAAELPSGWGLLEVRNRKVEIAVACKQAQIAAHAPRVC